MDYYSTRIGGRPARDIPDVLGLCPVCLREKCVCELVLIAKMFPDTEIELFEGDRLVARESLAVFLSQDSKQITNWFTSQILSGRTHAIVRVPTWGKNNVIWENPTFPSGTFKA